MGFTRIGGFLVTPLTHRGSRYSYWLGPFSPTSCFTICILLLVGGWIKDPLDLELFLVSVPSLGWHEHGPTRLSPSLIRWCISAFLLYFISPLDWAACPPGHIWCYFLHFYNPLRGMDVSCSLKPEWLHRVLHVFHGLLFWVALFCLGCWIFLYDLRQDLRVDIIFELSWGT